MLTYSLMGVLVAAILGLILTGCRYDVQKKALLSLNDTTVLKGLWCIVIILVHIPENHQNRIQDLIGSFAYVGVTFFFLASAYGLKFGIQNKKDYLKGFWKKRLPKLLIPMLIANVMLFTGKWWGKQQMPLLTDLIELDKWVKVFLLYYGIFWIVYWLPSKTRLREGPWQDTAICLCIAACSAGAYLLDTDNIWPTESWGFIWGILLARYMPQVQNWMADRWFGKTVMACLLSLVLGVLYLKYKPVVFFGDYCTKILLGAAMTLLVLLLSARFRIGNPVSRFLGTISYEIYLIHGVIIRISGYFGWKLQSGIYIWTIILLSVLSAGVVSRISRKTERLLGETLLNRKYN